MPAALKQSDLKPCSACERGVCHAKSITFYRIHVERFLVMAGAVQRQHHFEQMVGSAAIAAALSPDEDMAKRIGPGDELTLCDTCALDPLVVVLERISDRERERASAAEAKEATCES